MAAKTPKPQGIQSVDHALSILNHIKEAHEPPTLTELSGMTAMSKSRLQKYLVSLVQSGALTLDEKDKTYRLGPKLIELGLSALNKFDIVSAVDPFLLEIKQELNQSSALAIWTEKGPMVVKYQDSGRSINVEIEVGFYVPLLKSAVGKCFAAFLPSSITKRMIDQEIHKHGFDKSQAMAELEKVRENGFATRDTSFGDLPGSNSVACPIFDYSGEITAVLCLIGFIGDLDLDASSRDVTKLKEVAGRLSRLQAYPC